jgi:hypothetical protein
MVYEIYHNEAENLGVDDFGIGNLGVAKPTLPSLSPIPLRLYHLRHLYQGVPLYQATH